MLKRIFTVIFALFLILPLTVSAAGAIGSAQNPFDSYDRMRSSLLKEAINNQSDIKNAVTEKRTFSGAENNRKNAYLVKFTEKISYSDIYNIVEKYDFCLIADSSLRLFELHIDDYDLFVEKYGYAVSGIEKNFTRKATVYTNDPDLSLSLYNEMDIFNAWNYTTGSRDVVVAVLDTGVNREHEDFSGTNILAGYDTINNSTVMTDIYGHGTQICGLIAATANNGKGSAGVSYGATVLPIRVATTNEDFDYINTVKGIYFAADENAKIINMSFGGTTYYPLEQQAVDYAMNKGCIIVAAAGNDGENTNGDKAQYPASYRGVISVGSTDKNGIVSSFSQHNEFVDVTAPGENIPLMKYENGQSKYIYNDKGTSFSAAYVSGIAALAVSYLDSDVRFGGEEFLSLIQNSGEDWNEYYGYGIINAVEILELVNKPIVTGIMDGQTYTENVNISYNRGSVTLDGVQRDEKSFPVSVNGAHTLVITDDTYTRTIRFYVDNKPLTYQANDDNTVFTFDRGTATLDGFPYTSGQQITTSGDHIFVLSGPYSSTVTKKFTLNLDIPFVLGVTDGGVYNTAVNIRIIGSGGAMIDGTVFAGETVVGTDGEHSLVVTNSSGTKMKTYVFSIQNSSVKSVKTDLIKESSSGSSDNSKMYSIVDEKYGYILLYTQYTGGVAVYDINNPAERKYFAGIGIVTGYEFYNDNTLLIYHNNKVTKIARNRVLGGGASPVDGVIDIGANISACVLAGDDLYYVSGTSLLKQNIISGEVILLEQLSMSADTAVLNHDKTNIYLFNTKDGGNNVLIYTIGYGFLNTETNLLPVTTLGKKIVYGNQMVAIGNALVNENGWMLSGENNVANPVKFYNNLLFTGKYIINTDTNDCLAVFRSEITNVTIDSTYKVHVFYADGTIDIITNNSDPIADFNPAKFKAASYNDTISGGHIDQTDYDSYSNIYSGRSVAAFAAYGDWLYILCEGTPVLYKLNAANLIQVDEIPLRYIPRKICISGERIYVSFRNTSEIYTAQANSGGYGDYIDIGFIPSNLVVSDYKLVTLKGDIVSVYDFNSNTSADTNIQADGVFAADNTIYTSSGKTFSMYDLSTYAVKSSFLTGSKIDSFIISGDYMFTGNKVYSLSLKKVIYNTGDEALTSRGNTLFTRSGVFSLSEGEYISKYSCSGLFCYLDENFNYFTVSSNKITRISSANGTDLTEMPAISFIRHKTSDFDQEGIYVDGVYINYTYGIGYAGNDRLSSGSDYTVGGEHVFTLVLSCGIKKQISFFIIPALTGIQINNGNRRMNINETISLQISFLPSGTTPVEIYYNTEDKDIISIDQNGVVTALNEGTAKVTAYTSDMRFSDECTITVSKTLIKFNASAPYSVDRNNSLIIGVIAGTDTANVLQAVSVEGSVEILDRNGNPYSGVIGTGMIMILKNTVGEEIDRLIFAVQGDLSGDGYISTDDLYDYIEMLNGKSYEKAYVKAADINGDGSVNDTDMSALRSQLLYHGDSVNVASEPPKRRDINILSVVSVNIYEGEKVVVAIQLNEAMGVYAVSGRMFFNPEFLEYNRCTQISWNNIVYEGNGFVSFITYEKNKTGSTRNSKTLFELEFTLKKGTLNKQVLFDISDAIAVKNSESYTIRESQTLRKVQQRVNGDFCINIYNADGFTFDPGVKEYYVTVKPSTASLDIDATHPKNTKVSISNTVILDDDTLQVLVTYTDQTANTSTYIINVTREKEYIFDTNCYLANIEIEGYSLIPEFDRETTKYTLSVPYDTEKLNIIPTPESQKSLAEVDSTALSVGTNIIKVTCIAENGNMKIYTITVTREDKKADDVFNPDITGTESFLGKNRVYIVSVVFVLLAGAAVFIIIKKNKKKQ